MGSKRGQCANAPDCRKPVQGYGKCDECRSELRRLRALFVFFAKADSPDPSKNTEEREQRIRRFTARAARKRPLFKRNRERA